MQGDQVNQLLAAGDGGSSGGLHFPAIESLLEWPGFLFEGNTYLCLLYTSPSPRDS